MNRRVLGLAALAAALVMAYALYLSPEFEPTRDDQRQYLALARGLAERSEFTRATTAEAFIPEPVRTPGYPLFLAPLCRLGHCDHWAIALAQAAVVALIVLLTHALARRLLSSNAAIVAAAGVTAYVTFAYFGALALSDVLAAFLLLLGACAFVRAHETRTIRWAVACGVALGALALVRVLFLPVPLVFAAIAVATERRALSRSLIPAALAFTIVATPFFLYSYANFGRPLAGPGGGVLWLGYFQGLALTSLDNEERRAADEGARDIDALDAMTDRVAQARAWPALDDSLRARSTQLIAHHPMEWLVRGILRSIVLWAGDRPLRVADADRLQTWAAALLLAPQLALLAFGSWGAVLLTRRAGPSAKLPLAIVAFVWVLSFPFGTEGRYSLPAKPFLIIGSVALLSALRRGPPFGARRDAPAERG